MTAFQQAHASLAPLSVRELEFLLHVGACRLEQLREFEDGDGEREEAKPELSLAA